MWLFLPGGLLMPAATPTIEKDGVIANPELTENGRFDLQVRAREESHLTDFIVNFMEPGTFHPTIEATPQMDYNFRFYTTREAFAAAMSKAIIEDIDYLKFKPTAERKNEDGSARYPKGNAYHGVLNSIWGTLLRLGKPGGSWGAYSETNPNGYRPSKNWRGGGLTFSDRHKVVGSSFEGFVGRDDELEMDDNWTGDYTPREEDQIADLLSEMSDIPTDQWEDYLPESDFKLIEQFIPALQQEERTFRRRVARANRRTEKQNRRKAGKR